MKNKTNNQAHADDGLLRLIKTTNNANKKFNAYSEIVKIPVNVMFFLLFYTSIPFTNPFQNKLSALLQDELLDFKQTTLKLPPNKNHLPVIW